MITKKAKKPAKTKLRPVVICTAHRGVFFGYTCDSSGTTVHLKNARMAVYWESALKGVMGLASEGPGSGCKISGAVDGDFRAVTAVLEVSEAAVAKWEDAPWR